MGHFYPSQALDDPTPLALELENIPHCPKNININLKLKSQLRYIRDKGFLFMIPSSKSQVTHSTLEFCEY
jgi:hypothetical protein